MTRAELISDIATKNGITKVNAGTILANLEETIIDEVANAGIVKLSFGTFDSVERSQRNGRNPQTGEPMVIPATVVPRFKANKTFKDAMVE